MAYSRFTRPSLRGLVAALCTAVLLAGCSTPATPSAPETPATRTLIVLHVDGDSGLEPATEWFTDALAKRSNGALRVEFRFQCCGRGADVEQQLLNKVAAGDADLGWVGVRALHEAGTSAFDPLVAPLLVQSYQAEQAVLESDEAKKLLPELEAIQVQGLGLLPGALRYPLTGGKALDDPDAWQRLRFYSFASAVGYDALRALGARPLRLSFDERDAGFESGTIDALDNSLVYQANRTDTLPYALVGLPLWARVSALVAAPKLELSQQEREWVAGAVADTVARTPELAELDKGAVISGCANGAKYATTTKAEQAAFRSALAPVTSRLTTESDGLLETLQGLAGRAPVTRPLTCKTATPSPDDGDSGAELSGSFTTIDWTEAAQRAHGMPAAGIEPGGFGVFVFTFGHGSFRARLADGSVCTGSYAVDGDRVTVTTDPGLCGDQGRYFTATFAVNEQQLVFSDFDSPYGPVDGAVDAVLFTSEPMKRVN